MILKTYRGNEAIFVSKTNIGSLYKVPLKNGEKLIHIDPNGVDHETKKKTLYTFAEYEEVKVTRVAALNNGHRVKKVLPRIGDECFIMSRSTEPKVFAGKLVSHTQEKTKKRFVVEDAKGNQKKCSTTGDLFSREELKIYGEEVSAVIKKVLQPVTILRRGD